MKELFENIPKLLIILTIGTSLASFIHEWGFYSALGLQLHEIPFSATDQFKTWLTLIPAMVGLFSFVQMLSMAFVAVNRGSEEDEALKNEKTRWKRLPKRVRRYVQLFGVIGLLLVVLAFLLRGSPILGVAQLWVAIALYAFYEDIKDPNKSHWGEWALICTPFFCAALFYIGETSASTRVDQAPNAQITRKVEGRTETVAGKVLRTYEKFVLIAEAEGTFSLYATPDILSMKFVVKPKPENYPCIWLQVFCKKSG